MLLQNEIRFFFSVKSRFNHNLPSSQGPKYQNTYRLDSKKPFKPDEVYKILKNVVEKEVSNFVAYDGLMGPKIVQTIAAEVRSSVKSLNYDRLDVLLMATRAARPSASPKLISFF